MMRRAAKFARSFALAQACADLGARARTIHLVTGIPLPDIQRLFFNDPRLSILGRAPESADWYHVTNWINKLQASIFGSIYMRLRRGGFSPEDSLVGAYRSYLAVCLPPHKISFDRAFHLAGCTDDLNGRWTGLPATLCVVTCSVCRSEHLASIGQPAISSSECPFCRMIERHERDQRARDADTSTQSSATPDVTEPGTGQHQQSSKP